MLHGAVASAPMLVQDASSDAMQQSPAAATTTCLRELRIRDFALVADDVVSFRPGLNVVTGESGSGKSVLVSWGPVVGPS